MIDKSRVFRDSLAGASKGGAVAGAGSIITGIGLASVPVKILGFITVGSATVVSVPVVAGVAVGGAVVAAAYAGYTSYRRQCEIEAEFDRYVKGGQDETAGQVATKNGGTADAVQK
jgi:hypothetical protein